MISKYSVKRPYTVLVAVVLVIVLGAVSLSKMTTDLLPDMSFQYALVITTDMGASPEQVESDVTAPIESAMATTSNIKNISSVSYNSYSVVTLEYEQNANMDSVVIEIQQSLDQVSGQWDDSIGTPMIMKVNPDMMPVLAAAVDKDGMDANALSDYVKNDLAPALESLEGVASVTTTGQLEERVDVTLDQDKIDALNKKIQKKIDEQFEKSQKKIDAGKKKVESGKSSISQGSEQLNSAINQTMDQQKKLYKTEQDLKKQLAELKKQKASLEQIQTGIQTFMKSDAYTGIVTVLKDNPQLAESSEMQAQIKQVNAVVKKQFSALSSLGITVNTYEDLPAASAEVGKLLTKVNTGMKTIERAQQKVESGKVSLASALDTLNANASMTALQVSASSTELANAASSLESAQSKLDEAKDTAHDSADLNKVLSKDTITSLLAAQNFDMPAGYAMDGDTEYLVRVGDAVQDVDVYGYTMHPYEDWISSKMTEKKETGNKHKRYFLQVLNWRLVTPALHAEYASERSVTDTRQFCLQDSFYLPVYFGEITTSELQEKTVMLTKEQVKQLALTHFSQFLSVLEENGVRIVDKNVMIEQIDKNYHIYGQVKGCEKITTLVPTERKREEPVNESE